jgi:hypothetical protein
VALVAASAVGGCGGSDATTESGSRLSVGESAVVLDDLGEVDTNVEITPIKMEEGSISDLAGYAIQESKFGVPGASRPAEQARVTPYYVTVRFTNVGDGVPAYAAPQVGLDAVTRLDAGTDTLTVQDVGTDFRPCPPRDGPDDFRKGDTFETCLTFLVPQRSRFRGIAWEAHDLPDGGILWEP